MRLMVSAIAIVLVTGPLFAGDWTGFYAGAQVGQHKTDATGENAQVGYGLHGGYDIDYGLLVLGGELEVDRVDLSRGSGGQELSNIGRIKIRAGRDFGTAFAYAIVGGVAGDAPAGSETGTVYGLGILAELGDRLRLNGEALRQVIDNVAGNNGDLKTDSFNVRVSFQF